MNYLEEMAASGYHADAMDAFHEIAVPYLAEKLFPDKSSVVADIGAGWGHCLLPLKANGYCNLVALDIDDAAKSHFTRQGIAFHQADVEKGSLPLKDNSIDVFLCFHLVEHLYHPEKLFSEIWRSLKPGGLFVVVTPDWRQQVKIFWRDHTHRHPYDMESLPRLLRCFQFDIVWLKRFGVLRGMGRLGLWKYWKSLMFTGRDLIAVARKPDKETR